MLNEILRDAVAKLYPTVTLSERTRFLPMLDLQKGEISSTAAIEVARALRENAQGIAQKTIDQFGSGITGTWRSDLGYIVLGAADLTTLASEARTIEESFPKREGGLKTREVVCLTPDVTTPLYARLRLLAVTVLQTLLTVSYEGRCLLRIAPEPSVLVTSREQLLALLPKAVERLLAEEQASRRQIEGVLDGVPVGLATVFTSHHYHDSLEAPSKRYLADLKSREVINLRMPGDGWLISRERALTELLSSSVMRGVLAQLTSPDAWMRWLFHASSSIPSGDLDPMVALFDECASPLWGIRALIERFHRLCPGSGEAPSREALKKLRQVSEIDRALVVRSIFLPMWSARAVTEGEVVAWSTVLEEVVLRGHAFLNRPETRAALQAPQPDGETVQILAGLAFGLSSILPVVSEGA